VDPLRPSSAALCSKLPANMDPRHRDVSPSCGSLRPLRQGMTVAISEPHGARSALAPQIVGQDREVSKTPTPGELIASEQPRHVRASRHFSMWVQKGVRRAFPVTLNLLLDCAPTLGPSRLPQGVNELREKAPLAECSTTPTSASGGPILAAARQFSWRWLQLPACRRNSAWKTRLERAASPWLRGINRWREALEVVRSVCQLQEPCAILAAGRVLLFKTAGPQQHSTRPPRTRPQSPWLRCTQVVDRNRPLEDRLAEPQHPPGLARIDYKESNNLPDILAGCVLR